MNQIINIADFYSIYNNKIDTSSLDNYDKKTDFIESFDSVVSNNKKKLNSLKEKLTQISKLFSSDISDKILSCIDKYMEQLNQYNGFFNSDTDFTQEEITKVNEFAESINIFDTELDELIKESYTDLSNIIFESLKSGSIKSDELNQLISILNLNDNQKDAMLQGLNNYKNAEQQTVKDEEGKDSLGMTESDGSQLNDNTKKSDKDKQEIDVEYVAGSDYHNSVQNVKKHDRISELNMLIDELRSKGNLSFAEATKLYSLVEEREELRKSSYAKKDIASNLREKKLSSLDRKINDYGEQIKEELQKQEQMKSKLFKYVSNMKIGRLKGKVDSLQEKFGTVKSAQAAAAIHAYDAQNRMISFKAKLATAKKVITDSAKMVKNEFNNIKSDFSRFVSKKNKVQDMRNGNVIITNPPRTINLRLPEQQLSPGVIAI